MNAPRVSPTMQSVRNKSRRPRSMAPVAERVISGVRTLKDWELARNIEQRARRAERKADRRLAAFGGKKYYGPVSASGPYVRTPLFKQMETMPDSRSWHQERVLQVFEKLDENGAGIVGIDQLEASFAELQIPIDSATFTLYASEMLPRGTDYVSRDEFLKFHQVVWANQTAAVRRYAGDPRVAGDAPAPTPMLKSMQRTQSMPALNATLHEIRDNESMVRSAFKRYESNPGYLHRRHLASLFRDIGLDPGLSNDLGLEGSSRLNSFLRSQLQKLDADSVSFHDVIEIQNQYIAKLESMPQSERTPHHLIAPKELPESPKDLPELDLNEDDNVDKLAMIEREIEREASLQDRMMMLDEFSHFMSTGTSKPASPVRGNIPRSRRRLSRIVREEASCNNCLNTGIDFMGEECPCGVSEQNGNKSGDLDPEAVPEEDLFNLLRGTLIDAAKTGSLASVLQNV